ncbi:unnamed protein product [Rotaria magnacalcarata]|uniref:Otopetrin n=2 Tax=Rotaria magnacalcarata TaxID=392030 RepID=A0A816PUY3_9BILA|nr:unnamed protein product [Rotaria magnacalcarata]
MTQYSTSYTGQQPSRKLTSHNDDSLILQQNYSSVRAAVSKFDMPQKPTSSTSVHPPPLPSRHFVPTPARNNHAAYDSEASPSSVDSANSDRLRQTESRVNNVSTKNPIVKNSQLLAKPIRSSTKIDNQTAKQSKPIYSRRRTPPPIPTNSQDQRKFRGDRTNDAIHMNHGSELDEVQVNDAYEMDDESDMDDSGTFTAVAKSGLASREPPIPLSAQTHDNGRSKIITNGSRQKDERSVQKSSSQFKNNIDMDSIGLDIPEPTKTSRCHTMSPDEHIYDRHNNVQRAQNFPTNYEQNEIQEQYEDRSTIAMHQSLPPPPLPPLSTSLPPLPPLSMSLPPLPPISTLLPPLPPLSTSLSPFRPGQQQHFSKGETQIYIPKRHLPVSNFLLEIGALLVVFILCMVLVLAIREDETKLRTTMQLVYTYVYLVSIVWMVWCTFDIIRFRQQWMKITAPAGNHEEYMEIAERHPHKMFYFPDIHNTGGLFMRVGAGLLCMGGLILTIIELAKAITTPVRNTPHRVSPADSYPLSVVVTKSITYILRFLFHCVQFTFIFRYGNIVINRYHSIAKIGLTHLVIANFCTWFEAIVFETLEQLHKSTTSSPIANYLSNITLPSTTAIMATLSTTTLVASSSGTTDDGGNSTVSVVTFIKAISSTAQNNSSKVASRYEIITRIESTMNVYLYPCLIEYSLISLTVFFLMWKNVGKTREPFLLRFGDRHVFTVNCSRASRGLLVGGIILLVTILTLIPTYLLDDDAISVTHITELVLLFVSLLFVCISFAQTTKLYHDPHAHVDAFDRVLILITTVGDFAYSFFGLFASLFGEQSASKLPLAIEISIGFLAIFQTFLQSGFILDTLHRRTRTKEEIRNKPGREAVTALLLINLAIWLHDSLSAKKVRLNPIQVEYYDAGTWAIIQAFTSPLSIFYRFHSTVCLADVWQEVYRDNDRPTLIGAVGNPRSRNMSDNHETEH